MSKNRYINTHFWDDSFVIDLDPIEKLLFLYFLTNPLTNIAGAYEINLRRVAFDTGVDKDMVKKILLRFEKANKIIYKDGWVLILNFIKNQSTNPKVQKGIEETVKCCPDWVKDRLCIAYDSLSHLILFNLNTNTNAETAPDVCVPDDVPEITREESDYVEQVIDGIKKRLNIAFTLPKEVEWADSASWSWMAGFTPQQFLACYDHLKSQSWRSGRITATNVSENLPDFALSTAPLEPQVSKIDQCGLCDSSGLIPFKDGSKKCDHKGVGLNA